MTTLIQPSRITFTFPTGKLTPDGIRWADEIARRVGGLGGSSSLEALRRLTPAADKLPYFTGATTAALTDFPAFGRTLVGNASASDALSDLGFSAFIKTLIDDTNKETAQATLGITDLLGALEVATYTALRAYTGDATRVYVTGFTDGGTPSGIGGMFVLDDADITSADNGGTIIVDSSSRRWKRVFDGPLNVRWFGATGNGTTNDAAAIQAAVDYAISLGGRAVYFPVGSSFYNLGTTSIYCTTDGTVDGNPTSISLIGEANSKTDGVVLRYTGTSYALHFGKGTSASAGPIVVLRDFTLDGNSVGARGLYLKRAGNAATSEISRIRVLNFTETGVYLFRCYGIPITGCVIRENGGWGIEADNCNGFYLGPNTISQNVSGGVRVFYNNGTAGDGESDAGAVSAAGCIVGALIERSTGPGIQFEAVQSFEVLGCYIEGNDAGNAGGAQIVLTGQEDAVTGAFCRAVSIHGNRFQAGAGGGLFTDYAVNFKWAEDCRFYENQTTNHAVSTALLAATCPKINYEHDNYADETTRVTYGSTKRYMRNRPAGAAHYTTSDETESTATLENVSDLVFYVKAGKTYEAEWTMFYSSASAAVGIALAVNGPANTLFYMGAQINISASAITTGTKTALNNAVIAATSGGATVHMATMRCTYQPSADGELAPRYRTSSAGTTVTVHTGSFGVLRELPSG